MSRVARITLVVAFVALVGVAGVGFATGQFSTGEANLDVSISENEVSAGEQTELTFNVQNGATVEQGQATEQITTARGVRANVTDPGPFEVKTTNVALGSIPDGQVSPATFRVVVPEDVEPGTYDVEVRVRYEVTNRQSASSVQRLTRTEREEVEIEVVEEPRFGLNVSTAVQPGTSGDAEVTVTNDGSATAYNTQMTLAGSGSLTLDGGASEAHFGEFAPGDRRTVTVDASLAETASDADKPINATFVYEDEDGIRQPPQSVRSRLSPRGEQQFGSWSLDGTLGVGREDTIEGSVRNLGPTTLTDAEVVVEPQSESLRITDRRYALPELAPGETATFAFESTVDAEADPGPRQVRAYVAYAGNGSTTATSDVFAGRVVVDESQQFAIEDLESSLSIGFSGDVRGTLVNEGPEPVTDGVLVVEPQSESLFVEDTRYALPDLDPGERADFRYPVDVSGQADAGPRQARFTVEYQDGDRTLTSDPLSTRVVVDGRTEEFSITGEPTIRAGGSETVTLTITNERDQTLRNIDARLFTSDPLSATSDEAFVGELEPGESTEIQFDISASGGAAAKTYPVELDFQYDNDRGDEILSDTYQHPVVVQEAIDDGGDLPIVPLLGLVAVLVIAVVAWRRRERLAGVLSRES